MTTVNIINVESTALGDMAELILQGHISPGIGMILIDEDSYTWEVTGFMHDAGRTTTSDSAKLWTLRCSPVNSDKPMHTGVFKLMH